MKKNHESHFFHERLTRTQTYVSRETRTANLPYPNHSQSHDRSHTCPTIHVHCACTSDIQQTAQKLKCLVCGSRRVERNTCCTCICQDDTTSWTIDTLTHRDTLTPTMNTGAGVGLVFERERVHMCHAKMYSTPLHCNVTHEVTHLLLLLPNQGLRTTKGAHQIDTSHPAEG